MKVLIIGISGQIGNSIAQVLARSGYQVWGIDKKFPTNGTETLSGFSLVPDEIEWSSSFEIDFSDFLDYSSGDFFHAVIIATRYRSREKNGFLAENEIIGHLKATFIEPCLFYKYLVSKGSITEATTTIFLGSTNSLEISHQSLGYGAASAALVRAYKQLVVEEKTGNLYLILLGVLLPLTEKEMIKRTTILELAKFTSFLIENPISSLQGEPIPFAGTRLSLDATAVKSGFFNELFFKSEEEK